MDVLQITQAIFGLIIALFIPGYLIARIFFKELGALEKIALGFVLSIALDIIVGLFLGYNETMKNLTGGITTFNLWLYLGTITIMLFIVLMLKDEYDRKFFKAIFKVIFSRHESEKKIPVKKKSTHKK